MPSSVARPDSGVTNTTKFKKDVVWNFASFGVLAVSGILINLLIGRFLGPEALGVFNQVFALFIFVSQISVLGVHLSVLHKVSLLATEKGPEMQKKIAQSVSSALIASLAITVPVIMIGAFAGEGVSLLFGSADVAVGWFFALPGLLFFSFNKILLNAINALSHMRAFALFQASRYLLMVTVLIGMIIIGTSGSQLPLIITLSEIVLWVGLVAYFYGLHRHFVGAGFWAQVWSHIRFGLAGFAGGALSELNTRVDVIVLGIFLSDRVVGIYSIAALIMEGMAMIAVVLRNVFNPIIARELAAGRIEALRIQSRQLIFRMTAGMLFLSILIVVAYPLFVDIILADPSYYEGHVPLAILLIGVTIGSGYLVLNMVMVQAGLPVYQSIYQASIVATNLALNFLLVPWLGMIGAALGTAGAFLFSVVSLKWMARKKLSLEI